MKTTFKRYELKYFLTKEQKSELLKLFDIYMESDEYGQSCIYNLYYDTSEFLLIRRSIEKPIYKEKLRVRSYGRANNNSNVFLEIKKKYKSIVYKRRIIMSENEVCHYFDEPHHKCESQISKEIDYFKSFYHDIAPRVFLAYDREAFKGKADPDFRITFDENIIWRDYDLSLCSEKYGNHVMPEDMVLAEIKVSGGIPLWLTKFFSENKIYKTSFSKYGTAYKQILNNNKEARYVS